MTQWIVEKLPRLLLIAKQISHFDEALDVERELGCELQVLPQADGVLLLEQDAFVDLQDREGEPEEDFGSLQ